VGLLDGDPDPHRPRGSFEGEKGPTQDMSGGRYTQVTQQGAEPVRCGCRLGCTLAQPGECD